MVANLLAFMVILTVEDEFLISEYLRTILEAHGHKVVATFDADAAIGALEKTDDFQLVITDINMPGAMEWAAAGCGNQRKVAADPSIVVTGFTPPKRTELPLGSLFVPKPYGPRDILTAVAHFQ